MATGGLAWGLSVGSPHLQGFCSVPGLQVGRVRKERLGQKLWRARQYTQARKTWAGTKDPEVLSNVVEGKGIEVADEATTAAAGSREKMVWVKNWYPILPVIDAHVDEPYGFRLLGKKMVLWRDGDGEWSCLDDRCPHRQTPLSRGRPSSRDGSLMCSFHGWCFDRQGNCVRIPQATEGQHDTLCGSDRSKVQAYPVQIKQGLIWVWPDQSPQAWVDSAMKEIDVFAPFDGHHYPTYELPCGYHAMVEMFFDPAHAATTHEGQLFGASPDSAIPFSMTRTKFGFDGIGVKMTGYLKSLKAMEGTKEFIPPVRCTSTYAYNYGLRMIQNIHFVPSTPGSTRVLGGITLDLNPDYKPENLSGFVINTLIKLVFGLRKFIQTIMVFWMPQSWKIALWHNRQSVLTFFAQDMYVLYGTDQVLEGKEKNWKDEYHMPTGADVGVASARQWLDRYSAGDVTWDPLSEPFDSKSAETCFDRWNQHVRHCKNCQSTAKNLITISRILRNVALVVFLVSGGLAFYPKPAALKYGVAGIASAGVCMLIAFKIDDVLTYFRTSVPPRNLPGNINLGYKGARL